jgi:hypothetical protein
LVGGGGLHRAGDPPWSAVDIRLRTHEGLGQSPELIGRQPAGPTQLRFAVFAAFAPDSGRSTPEAARRRGPTPAR